MNTYPFAIARRGTSQETLDLLAARFRAVDEALRDAGPTLNDLASQVDPPLTEHEARELDEAAQNLNAGLHQFGQLITSLGIALPVRGGDTDDNGPVG